MNHSPEPLAVYQCFYCQEDEACGFNGRSFDYSYDECHHPMTLEFAERIVACVNFCRQFDTEFLESRQLVKVESKDNIKFASDVNGFDGFVPCTLLPIEKTADT